MAKYVKTEDGYQEIKTINSNKMDMNNPVGTGSFSMGRLGGSIVGLNSHAEGSGSVASGNYSHAEGSGSVASGRCSHAEGINTTASGNYSHAEGSASATSGNYSHAEGHGTGASGDSSHAEGFYSVASGAFSHAEGHYSTASGDFSHAEGINTTASGAFSHAEGFYSVASGAYQHVQGKFNIKDTYGKYAHIVGNGELDVPSNAHTLDWSGNAWFAGTVEGTAAIIKSSTDGSSKRFKITVDDSGVISATEITT